MGLILGIDVGTVSAKWALIGTESRISEISADCPELGPSIIPCQPGEGLAIALSRYTRIQGSPVEALSRSLEVLLSSLQAGELEGAVVTGAAAPLVARRLKIPVENEFKAAAVGVGRLYPDIEHIFEMGGENSKYIRIESGNGLAGICDFETNGDCAAGTGSFIDQQAGRLCFDVEDVGRMALSAGRSPRIAGRCSVFAKSDMIHAQQKGFKPEEVLKGLCEAVARNFKSNITRGKKIKGRTAFIGGLAMNAGVAEAIRMLFDFGADEFFVPPDCAYMGAIGSAIIASADVNGFDYTSFSEGIAGNGSERNRKFPSWTRLSREKVRFLRDRVDSFSFDGKTLPVDAWLGIDVGSVSTNLALIDEDGSVIREIYLRTSARPIEAVGKGLERLDSFAGGRIRVRGVGTTGSGRELIGELVGADTINDEITAHKTGASFIGKKLLGKEVDTIFEIGGQDSKYIRIVDGVVVDFTMNEACAAGTGSFLEEQAVKLDIEIKGEFSERAFASRSPIRLGERCTVYMEQDVSQYVKKGAVKNDLVAGLAYSIVQNYLNRVVRGRKPGEVIFFQGGTAYNDSVAAAFSEVLGREIIVPPYNGVIGAIGAALLAREKTVALDIATSFRGFDLSKIDYSIREFSCGGCSNFCNIQEFTVMGEKTYWGDKCSNRYRKAPKVPGKPVIPDMVSLYLDLLEKDDSVALRERAGISAGNEVAGEGSAGRIGIPKAMYYYDMFPFWRTYLQVLGFEVVTGPDTNRTIINTGVEETVAEPCSPVQAAHGHVAALLKEKVDMILLPNVIDAETDTPRLGSYICPWGQTLPFVIRSMPSLEGREDMIAAPTVHFRDGQKRVEKELWPFGSRLGAKRADHRRAVRAAYAAQDIFRERVSQAGARALERIEAAGEQGVVIAGRPYNIFDREINLDVPAKLRDYYGMNVIPMYFLPLDGIDVTDAGSNMFWNYGRRILQAARFLEKRENLHLVFVTNFKCGPDSYIKHFCSKAAGRPWLTLQFDAHGNDAGIMTRCEAYLDSKGVLRWWKKKEKKSRVRQFTFRECPPEAQKPLRRHSGTWG